MSDRNEVAQIQNLNKSDSSVEQKLYVIMSFVILTLGFIAVGFSRLVVGVHSLN